MDENQRERESTRQSRKEQEMNVCLRGWGWGSLGTDQGHRALQKTRSAVQTPSPLCFSDRGNTLSSAVSRLVSLQNLSSAR